MEDAIASPGLEDAVSNYVGHSEELSQEDVAWADSCLVNDLEVSRNGWDSWSSFSNALDEATSSAPDSSQAGSTDISFFTRELSSSDILIPDEETDKYSGDKLINEDTDLPRLRFNMKNVFRPTYNEDLPDGGTNDAEESEVVGLSEEESPESIFKVWNLDTSAAEEDEFMKQLNKAFSESSPAVTSPRSWENASIDDVINGLADLSLNCPTS